MQLIDIAVKAGGLNVAQAGAILAAKLTGQEQPNPEMDDSPIFAEAADLTPHQEEED